MSKNMLKENIKVPNSKTVLKVVGMPLRRDTPQPIRTEEIKQIKAILMSLGMAKKNSFNFLFFNASTIAKRTISKTIISKGFGIKVL